MRIKTGKITMTSVAIATVIALFQACNHYTLEEKHKKEEQPTTSISGIEPIEKDDIFTPADTNKNTGSNEIEEKTAKK